MINIVHFLIFADKSWHKVTILFIYLLIHVYFYVRIPKRFLPAPVPISTSDNGLKIDPKKGSFRSLFQSFYLASTLKLGTCYDEYCPSLQERNAKDERVIDRRTCKNCSLYHSTIAAMKKDKRVCQHKQEKDCLAEELSSEESDVEDDVWVTDDELTGADGQANIFERINQCFGI